MFEVKNLSIDLPATGEQLFTNISLSIPDGKVHAFVTAEDTFEHSGAFSGALSGHKYLDLSAEIFELNGECLLEKQPHEISKAGLFVCFRHRFNFEQFSFFELFYATMSKKFKNEAEALEKYLDICFDLNLPSNHMDCVASDFGSTTAQYKLDQLIYAILGDSDLIILDHFEEGLDTDQMGIAVGVLKEFVKGTNKKILIITSDWDSELLNLFSPNKYYNIEDGAIKSVHLNNVFKGHNT